MERFSPHLKVSQVQEQEMQEGLRRIFTRLGMPQRIRLDNGTPFANQRDRFVPTNLILWVVALGISPIFNPPRKPQRNGRVECMQRVSCNWAGPRECSNPEQLQQKLNEIAHFHLHYYRIRRKGDYTRAELFPELLTAARNFKEATLDAQRIRNYLANIIIVRQASAIGIVGFASQEWNIGIKNARKGVTITFNTHSDSWEIKDVNGGLLKKLPPLDLSEKAIEGLTVMAMNGEHDKTKPKN